MPVATAVRFTMYTTAWCGDCHRIKHWLTAQGFQAGKEYIEINIDEDQRGREIVEHINQGNRSVPTLLFPDGTSLTEPNYLELANKLRTSPLAN